MLSKIVICIGGIAVLCLVMAVGCLFAEIVMYLTR